MTTHPRLRKPFFEYNITRPSCSERIHIKAQKKVLTPARPAEVELEVFVEKSAQTTLEEAS